MLKFGKYSERSPNQNITEICRDLRCGRLKYTWMSYPALEGTACGPNKVKTIKEENLRLCPNVAINTTFSLLIYLSSRNNYPLCP